jgi:hypothetical protein
MTITEYLFILTDHIQKCSKKYPIKDVNHIFHRTFSGRIQLFLFYSSTHFTQFHTSRYTCKSKQHAKKHQHRYNFHVHDLHS